MKMKMRIRDNSLRLRLTQGEVTALRREHRVAARIAFPAGRMLDYSCEASASAASPTASFDERSITVLLPLVDVETWADTDQVSISAGAALEDGGELAILVEKDFACLAPREGEDESDMFAHPQAGKETC